MKPRRLKDGRLVVPVMESGGMLDGGKDVVSIGLQVLTPQDPAFATWQKYISGAPKQETPPPSEEPTPEEDDPTQKSEETPILNAVEVEKRTGVILALYPDTNVRNQLSDAVKAAGLEEYAEPQEDYHITLVYLGKIDQLAEDKEYLVSLLFQWAKLSLGKPIHAVTSGYGRFNNDEGEGTNAVYASIDSLDLIGLRESLLDVVDDAGIDVQFTHGFTPHITLAYIPETVDSISLKVPNVDITFTAVTLAWGDEHTTITLGGNT